MGVKWAIFDMDDTLTGYLDLEGQTRLMGLAYKECREVWYTVMTGWGFNEKNFIPVQREWDIRLIKEQGYGERLRFGESFVITYEQLANKKGEKLDPKKIRQCRDIAEGVYHYPYVALPGALDVLREVSQEYKIGVITRGPVAVQIEKAETSGIMEYIDEFRPVDWKDESEWLDFLATLGLRDGTAQHSWAVGNSLEADVARPMELGLNGIFVDVYRAPVERHLEEAPTPLTGRQFHVVDDIRAVTQFILGE